MKNEDNFILENNIENNNQKKSLGDITNSYYNDNSQQNSKIILTNSNERITEQIKDYSSNLNGIEDYKDIKRNRLLESEEIFINQKKEIEKMREKNKIFLTKKLNNTIPNKNNYTIEQRENETELKELKESNNIIISKENSLIDNDCYDEDYIISFSLNEPKYFEISLFDYNQYDEEKQLIPEINEEWKPSNYLFSYYSEKENPENTYNYIELNRLALRCTHEIDYFTRGLELHINLNLIGDSELWIFTRSNVNKSINESYYFDENSVNIEEKDNFNKYSSVIKITKERNSNKCFVIFGTFCEDINENKLYYKSFLKRQLIDFSEYNNYFNFEEDKCELDIYATDLGDEIINAKIFLNNKKKFNDISAKFFLPINKKAKLLVCGTGKSVQLKELNVKIFDKENVNIKSIIQFETDNEIPKSCECCSII